MDAGEIRTNGTPLTEARSGSSAKKHTQQVRQGDGGASSLSRGSLRFQPTIAVEGSFQAFLAEQTALLATADQASASSFGGNQQATPATSKPEDTAEAVHILQRGETIWELARERYHLDTAVLLRYNNITSPGTLQAGAKIRIPGEQQTEQTAHGQEVVAGWYGSYHHGRLMANGRRFDMHKATIAHRSMPIGTRVELENPQTGEKAQAVVTDRGPYHRGRDVDLSYGLAKRLSLTTQGVGNLKMRVL